MLGFWCHHGVVDCSFCFDILVSKDTITLGLMLQAIKLRVYMKILRVYMRFYRFIWEIDTCFWPIRSQYLLQLWSKWAYFRFFSILSFTCLLGLANSLYACTAGSYQKCGISTAPDCFKVSRLLFSRHSKSFDGFVLLNVNTPIDYSSIEHHGRGLHCSSQKALDMPSSRLYSIGHAPNFIQCVGTCRLISHL